MKLSSCGIGGAIYEWDLTEPDHVKRSSEYITKSIIYNDCSIGMDGRGTYAVGADGKVCSHLKLITIIGSFPKNHISAKCTCSF